jgi:hypothetical protein
VLAVMASKNLYYSAYSWDAAYAGAFTLLILSLAMDRQRAVENPAVIFLMDSSSQKTMKAKAVEIKQ